MTDIDILFLISKWQGIVMTICCLLCFFFFNIFNASQQILSYFLFFMLIMNNVMQMVALEHENNLSNSHIIALGEFIFLSLYFKKILKNNHLLDMYFKAYMGVIGFFIIMNTIYVEPINTFNTNAKILVIFCILSFAVLFFIDRSKQLMEVDVHEKSIRLINVALLLYYSGSFFVFLFYKFTLNNEIFYSTKMLIFNAAWYLLFTILMLIAILMVVFDKKKKEIKEG